MASMNLIFYVNIAVVIILFVFIRGGYKEGFLIKLLSVLSFFVVGFLSWWLSSFIGKFLSLYPKDALPLKGTPLEGFVYDNMNRIVLFVILFALLNIGIIFLRPLFKMVGSLPIISTFNKIAGCILGGVQALFLLVLATMVLRLPFWKDGNTIASQSLLRYSDPIAKAAMFYVKEPMQELQKLDSAVHKKEALSESEIEDLRTWMLQQNIDKEKADEFISMLRT